jgi:geranylgeranylglycerol-phosphate geranylgeranyltransferase
MGKARAFARLTRVEHSLILVVAVIAAELISGGLPPPVKLAASIITPILVSMASFAINDYFDIEADKANGFSTRPLVSGELSAKTALYSSVVMFVVGAGASAAINAYAFAIAVVFAALAFLYSYKLKDLLLLGNLYIALSMVIPFVYGNFVVARSLASTIVLVSLVVFLSGLAREVHGMIRDREGDAKARRSMNLVRHIGPVGAGYISLILYFEAIAISVYMFFYSAPFIGNAVYIVPIAVTDIMLAYVALGGMLYKKKSRYYRISRNLSLLAMAIATLAYLAAALVFIRI